MGSYKKNIQLTESIRGGNKEGTKMNQEEGKEIGISEVKATTNPEFSSRLLVDGSLPKGV